MAAELESARRLQDIIASTEPHLRAIPSTVASSRPSPGTWSICEIVGHLVDSASNNHQRFVRAVWQDDLVFVGYRQDAWVEMQQYHASDWPDLITLWASFNRHIAQVMAAIPDSVRVRVHDRHNLQEVAFRPPAVPTDATLAYFMSDYVDHLEHHVRQILGRRGATLG